MNNEQYPILKKEELEKLKNEKLIEIMNRYGDKSDLLKDEVDLAITKFEQVYGVYGLAAIVLNERLNGGKTE